MIGTVSDETNEQMNQQNAENSSDLLTFLPLQTLLIAFHDLLHCDFARPDTTAGHGLLKGPGEGLQLSLAGCAAAGPSGRGFLPLGAELHPHPILASGSGLGLTLRWMG